MTTCTSRVNAPADKLSSARSSWTKKLALERERVILVSPSGHLEGADRAYNLSHRLKFVFSRRHGGRVCGPSPRTDSLQGVRRKQEGSRETHRTHGQEILRSYLRAAAHSDQDRLQMHSQVSLSPYCPLAQVNALDEMQLKCTQLHYFLSVCVSD